MKVLPGGKVAITNVSLLMIVAAAWDVPFQSPRFSGGREWQQIRGERYDIEAEAPEGAIPPGLTAKERGDLIRPMMQALLAERFRLRMTRQSREQPVYFLEVAKDGPKLRESKVQEKDCNPADPEKLCHRVGGGQAAGIHGDAVDMDDVALFVENWAGRAVIDRTGLKTLYNIQTEGWAAPGTEGTSLAGVFRPLGIEMTPARAAVDMFFVEHVERPAEN
jgi:uncharacterized protein (TIGR03435 family)